MQLERLDLLCYGCFKGKQIDFPSDKAGLHIIYGPNEAGKSTALSAIEDLLFGIPKNSKHNFRFDNKDLRIGAVVHSGGKQIPFTFRRRKGNKDTIIDEKDSPLPDTLLGGLLQGVDRSFFERMFSLSHERLRKGGQEILDEKDDVGQTLFSASAGLLGLAKILKKLEENAAQLWSPKKSGKRLYYQAQEKYEDAKRRKRDATKPAKNWKEDKDRLAKISEEHKQKNLLFSELTARQEKLQRIRSTLPYLVQIKRREQDISTIGTVPRFSENASEVLEAAGGCLNQADATLKTLDDQINEAQKELDEICPDENLLAREKDIEKLGNERAVIDKHEKDIPNRQTEIKVLEDKRRDLVVELGWPLKKIEEENFFPQTLSLRMEKLITEKGSLETGFESTNDVLQEEKVRCNAIQQEIADLSGISEITPLETAIRNVKAKGDLRKELKRSEVEISRLSRGIETSLKNLQPWTGSIEDLKKLSFPQVVTIGQYDQEFADLKKSQKEIMEEEERLQDKLIDHRLKREQLLRDKQAIAPEQLEKARQHRNSGWNIIRRKYLEDDDVLDEEVNRFSNQMPITEAYEKSVKSADALADNRFVHAKETAQLAEISRALERFEQTLEILSKKKSGLQEKEDELESRWQTLWGSFRFVPLIPQEMLAWMGLKSTLLDDYEQRLLCVGEEETLKASSEEARNLLLEGLKQLGQDTGQIKDQPVGFLLEYAETIKFRLDKQSTRLEELRKQALLAKQQRGKATDKSDKAIKKKQEWEEKWQEGLNVSGFPLDSSQEDILFFLTKIKEIKKTTQEIAQIRSTRIEAMKRDIEKFHEDILKLSEEIDITQTSADDKETVHSLVRRLEEERNKKSQRETQSNRLIAFEKSQMQEKENREKALANLQPLMKMAKTEDISVLREQIRACDQLRALEKNTEESLTELIKQGDGKNKEELEQECEKQDADQVKADLVVLKNELEEIHEDIQKISEEKKQATTDLEKILGSADAAAAESDRQLALTDMSDAAEGYVRSQTAAILLRWGMEKFRKEKQGPLLERASAIFRVLTLEKFSKLTVELDDNDTLYLAGIRLDDTRVGVEGMSDGTVDQLYLALRLAAIEEYVQKSQPLPFVADDLFINYDDSRAAAGFKALSELSQKTQVLFFTHHKHLVNVAKEALSPDQFVIHDL